MTCLGRFTNMQQDQNEYIFLLMYPTSMYNMHTIIFSPTWKVLSYKQIKMVIFTYHDKPAQHCTDTFFYFFCFILFFCFDFLPNQPIPFHSKSTTSLSRGHLLMIWRELGAPLIPGCVLMYTIYLILLKKKNKKHLIGQNLKHSPATIHVAF